MVRGSRIVTDRRRRRRRVAAIGLALGAALAGLADRAAGADDRLRVRVDPRVELCCIISRLAGFDEYSKGRVPSYLEAIDAHFAPQADHAVIGLARRLRAERGVGFDACMAVAIHMAAGDEIEPIAPLENRALELYGDGRWTPEAAMTFIAVTRNFAVQAGFGQFYADHGDLYELTERRMRAFVDEHMHLEWFARFYGVEPAAPFTIVPGLVNGPANYGPKYVDPDGIEHLYAIIGVHQVDGEGMPEFDRGFLGTVVHEFNHSFVNHVVEAHREALEPAGELIQDAVGPAMKRQAYGNWWTIINESVVRAAVVRYMREYEGEAAARHQIRQEEDRSFLWIAPLEQLLGEYEASREAYPTFADYMPRIVAFLNEYAPTLADEIARRDQAIEADRPHVVSIEPASGREDVEPATTEIIISFDRPMKGGYQVMKSDRGAFPGTSGVAWNADRTVLTMRVALEPDTLYAFSLNTASGGAFRSAAASVPLKFTPVWFRTAKR